MPSSAPMAFNSVVRDTLFGETNPAFTGRIAYRTVYPATRLNGYPIDDCTKWWGPDRHIVIYYVKPDRSEVYFVTSQPEPGFAIESWSATGDVNVLRDAFADFHPQVQHVLASCPAVHKRPLVDHDPLPRWAEGNITLLGDACHPMTPYMAQGAAMAFEDAAVLSRCLDGADRSGVADAFRRFEFDPQAAHVASPARIANKHLASRPDQPGLGLRLRCLDGSIGQLTPRHGMAAAAIKLRFLLWIVVLCVGTIQLGWWAAARSARLAFVHRTRKLARTVRGPSKIQ